MPEKTCQIWSNVKSMLIVIEYSRDGEHFKLHPQRETNNEEYHPQVLKSTYKVWE